MSPNVYLVPSLSTWVQKHNELPPPEKRTVLKSRMCAQPLVYSRTQGCQLAEHLVPTYRSMLLALMHLHGFESAFSMSVDEKRRRLMILREDHCAFYFEKRLVLHLAPYGKNGSVYASSIFSWVIDEKNPDHVLTWSMQRWKRFFQKRIQQALEEKADRAHKMRTEAETVESFAKRVLANTRCN